MSSFYPDCSASVPCDGSRGLSTSDHQREQCQATCSNDPLCGAHEFIESDAASGQTAPECCLSLPTGWICDPLPAGSTPAAGSASIYGPTHSLEWGCYDTSNWTQNPHIANNRGASAGISCQAGYLTHFSEFPWDTPSICPPTDPIPCTDGSTDCKCAPQPAPAQDCTVAGVLIPADGALDAACVDGVTLADGASCTLTCAPGFTLSGAQPSCAAGTLSVGSVACSGQINGAVL